MAQRVEPPLGEAPDEIAKQNSEFDAVRDLTKQWRRLEMTPVVDDDYPEVRHDYDSALRTLLEKVRANRGSRW